MRLERTLNDGERDRGYAVEARIPWKLNLSAAPHIPPVPGDVWHLGVNREDQFFQDGQKRHVLSMWCDPGLEKPDFHVPSAFGRMVFGR
ncbi:MAG: hypothetical protein HYU36_11420 [Planctomycetes bacterium]|nr:hypothetical protein [Planctomycetota bacterium]